MKKLFHLLFVVLMLSFSVSAQKFTEIHNAQAIDWLAGVKYLGIPYGPTPVLNTTTRTVPGALFFNTSDSSLYTWSGAAWIRSNNASAVNSTANCSRLLNGSVTYTSALTFRFTDLDYNINCRLFHSLAGNLTLGSPGALYTTYYTIYVDTSGNYGAIQYPTLPVAGIRGVDPASQLELMLVAVAPDGTIINISNEDVYKENIEPWTGATSIAGASFVYDTLPYAGSYSTHVPAFVNNDTITWSLDSLYSVSDVQNINYELRHTTTWDINTWINIQLFNDGVIVGYVKVVHGSYQFNRADTGWRFISVPGGDIRFNTTSQFNKIKIVMSGANTAGFQLDNIVIQTGGALPTTSGLLSFNTRTGPNVIPERADYAQWFGFSFELRADSSHYDVFLNGVVVDSLPTLRDSLYAGVRIFYDTTPWGTKRINVDTTGLSGGGSGSGTVNSGTLNRLAYYAATGNAVSELAAITANRALISDANGLPTHSATTATELSYVSGVTSAIQTQLNAKLATATAASTYQPIITTSEQSETASGSTSFTFIGVPASYSDYDIIRNGDVLLSTTHFTTAGNVVTIPGADIGDLIIFKRKK